MSASKSISFRNFLSLFLALYLFNYSIDSRDSHADHIAEDLSLNDIESLLEFTLEFVFGWENFMREHDEQDDRNGSLIAHHIFIGGFTTVTCLPADVSGIEIVHHYRDPQQSFVQNSPDILSPPPRFI